MKDFQQLIIQGIPSELPMPQMWDVNINHAPKRKDILNIEEKKLALQNALRYFEPQHHTVLAEEFLKELNDYGRIYMYRFRELIQCIIANFRLNCISKYIYTSHSCLYRIFCLYTVKYIGESSNGRTADFDSVSLGSNPSSPKRELKTKN